MSKPMPGDFFGSGVDEAPRGSAMEKYFQHMLLKERLKASADSQADADKLLKSLTSERDAIRFKALQQIASIPESSPEFAQLASFFKTTDKFDLAEKIADDQYAKIMYDNIINSYGVPKTEIRSDILKHEEDALRVRAKRAEGLRAKGAEVPAGAAGAFVSAIASARRA